MRPLRQSLVPAGYVPESATVTYSSKRCVAVSRNAVTDYQEGTPVLLMQDGAFVPASVVGVSHNTTEGKLYLLMSEAVSPGIYGLLRYVLASHAYGNSVQTGVLYHFENNGLGAVLYDAAVNSVNHSTDATKMALVGTAPVLTSSQAKFGATALQGTGAGCYRNPAWNVSLFGWTWYTDFTVECHVYGQPDGVLLGGVDKNGSGYQYGNLLRFVAGRPNAYAMEDGSSYYASVDSSVLCLAGQWNHVVFDYSLSTTTLKILMNGSEVASGAYQARNIRLNSFLGDIRSNNGPTVYYSSGYFSGIIDELRWQKVSGIYQAGYAVPSKPFGPDAR